MKTETGNGSNKLKYYNTSFYLYVGSQSEEGLYNLYFHNCQNYNYKTPVALDFTVNHIYLKKVIQKFKGCNERVIEFCFVPTNAVQI